MTNQNELYYMGDNLGEQLKIGNANSFTIPTLMDYFAGKIVSHIEVGNQYAVVAVKLVLTLFTSTKQHKSRNSFMDVIIIAFK